MERTDLLAALDGAIRAEEEARSFYQSSAEQTDDPGGAAMFRELAEFERHHKERLEVLKASLESGGSWIDYEGRVPSKIPKAEAGGRPAVGDHVGALEALQVAISAEERAEAEYRALAASAQDERGRNMFRKLAEEEAAHRKLLDDQYYALSNRGVWTWGD